MKIVPVSVMALFCEDIREETGSTFTIVGVLPDNLNMQAYPSAMAKLCIYIRVNYDPSADINSVKARLVPSDGETLELGEIDRATIESSLQVSKKTGRMSGLVLRAYLVGYTVNKPGVLRVEVDVSGETYLAGLLNFVTD